MTWVPPCSGPSVAIPHLLALSGHALMPLSGPALMVMPHAPSCHALIPLSGHALRPLHLHTPLYVMPFNAYTSV